MKASKIYFFHNWNFFYLSCLQYYILTLFIFIYDICNLYSNTEASKIIYNKILRYLFLEFSLAVRYRKIGLKGV